MKNQAEELWKALLHNIQISAQKIQELASLSQQMLNHEPSIHEHYPQYQEILSDFWTFCQENQLLFQKYFAKEQQLQQFILHRIDKAELILATQIHIEKMMKKCGADWPMSHSKLLELSALYKYNALAFQNLQ